MGPSASVLRPTKQTFSKSPFSSDPSSCRGMHRRCKPGWVKHNDRPLTVRGNCKVEYFSSSPSPSSFRSSCRTSVPTSNFSTLLCCPWNPQAPIPRRDRRGNRPTSPSPMIQRSVHTASVHSPPRIREAHTSASAQHDAQTAIVTQSIYFIKKKNRPSCRIQDTAIAVVFVEKSKETTQKRKPKMSIGQVVGCTLSGMHPLW